ncbi:MAG: endonuclease domain-containing protein [Dongiaceae bacterium]
MTDQRINLMRRFPTKAEQLLWHHLRKKRIGNLRFRRQFRLDHCIVDFVCLPIRLVIEVDGPYHDQTFEADSSRTARLSSLGFRVLRFSNDDVMNNLEGVVRSIENEIVSTGPPLPLAPSHAGRGDRRKRAKRRATRP